MDSFLLDTGFSRCHFDKNVYTKRVDVQIIIIMLYVDDRILTSSDPKLINYVKYILTQKFDMTDLGHSHYFPCLEVLQYEEGISLSQSKYVNFSIAFTWNIVNQPLLPFNMESSYLSHVLPLK